MNREANHPAVVDTMNPKQTRRLRFWRRLTFPLVVAVLCGFAVERVAAKDKPRESKGGTASQQTKSRHSENKSKSAKWQSLFDGKTLKGWKITKFGGQGEVKVEKGRLILGVGADMTGVHTARKLPKINYEVELDAMRVDGSDFFCGLTFPVGKKPCSLIIGGWGGGVCGLSSIDGMDASENETTTYRTFKKSKWFKIRLRVSDTDIQAWIDGKRIVNQKTKGRKISIRQEVELSKPFGFATWQTTGALRNIRIRPIKPETKTKRKGDSK